MENIIGPVVLKPIEQVGKGNYFRFKGKKKVFESKGYCRVNKKYETVDFEDTCNFKYLKKGTMVETDFTF